MARSPTVEVLVLCGIVFVFQQLVRIAAGMETMLVLVALSTPLGEFPWTLATSVYAHAGISHLLGNAIVIALVGLPLERLTTPTRFHAFFFATGAAAGVFQVVVTGLVGTGTAVLGASGAAFALLGYVTTANRVTGGLFDRLSLAMNAQLVLFVAVAVVVAVVTYSPGIALAGHFFGFLLGLLAGRVNLLRTG